MEPQAIAVRSPSSPKPLGLLSLAGQNAATIFSHPLALLGVMVSSSLFWLCLLGLQRRWQSVLLPLLRGELGLGNELAGAALLLFGSSCAASTLGSLSLCWLNRRDKRGARRDEGTALMLGALCTTSAIAIAAEVIVLFCLVTGLGTAISLALHGGRTLQAAALFGFVAVPSSLLLVFVGAGGLLALARIGVASRAPSPLAGPSLLAGAVADLLSAPWRSLLLLLLLGLVTAPGWVIALMAFAASLTTPSPAASLLLLIPTALGSGVATTIIASGLERAQSPKAVSPGT